MPDPTYWQNHPEIIGPARKEQFRDIGQQETRVALERIILAHSSAQTSLLDAGCNTGVEGYRLFESGFPGSYTGVDSNPKAIHHALDNLAGRNARFLVSDLTTLPFPDAEFHIVLNKDVIEHAASYDEILRELLRVTRRTFILSMFIKPGDAADHISRHQDGYYLNRYNRRRLYTFAAVHGFPRAEVAFEHDQDEVIVFTRT